MKQVCIYNINMDENLSMQIQPEYKKSNSFWKKKSEIFSFILAFLIFSVVFTSCDDDDVDILIPDIGVEESEINVGYNAGDSIIDVTSNVIYYANVDPASKSWLSYEFSDNCQTFAIVYYENDTSIIRTGTITLSKGDSLEVLTVIQEANPNTESGGFKKVDIDYTINAGTYKTLSTSAEETAKIPIGATVVFECSSDVGSISLLDASYATYFSGNPLNGKISFVWTQDIATKASTGILGMLNDGCDVTGMYCLYTSENVVFSISSGTYNTLNTTVEETTKIPVGATVVFECSSDVGSISLLDASYATYFSGSPLNGKISFVWTQDMVTKASTGILGMLNDGCDITGMYFIYVETEIGFTINSGSRITINITTEETAKIPVGATLVFICSSDVGSISLIDGTYATYFSGSPVDGKIECIWTQDMATKASTGILGLLNDDCDVTGMYCHN